MSLTFPEAAMALGAVIWLIGEFYAIFTGRSQTDTTSAWVWVLERKWPWVRIVIAAALLWLALHFEFHIP